MIDKRHSRKTSLRDTYFQLCRILICLYRTVQLQFFYHQREMTK